MNIGCCPNQLPSKYRQRWTELIVLYELGVWILGKKVHLKERPQSFVCCSLPLACLSLQTDNEFTDSTDSLLHIPAIQGPQSLHLHVKEEAFREGLMKEQINEINSLQHFQGWGLLCSFLISKLFPGCSFLQGGNNSIPLGFQLIHGL